MTLARALRSAEARPTSGLAPGADAVDASLQAMIVFATDGAILSANPAARSLYGHAQTRAGASIDALAAGAPASPRLSPTARLDHQGRWQGLLHRRGVDGRPIVVMARWSARLGHSGEIRSIVEVGAERVSDAALDALRQREDRYRSLFQRAPIALMLADARGIGDLVRELRASGVTDLSHHMAEDLDFLNRAIDIVAVAEVNDEAMRMFGATTAADLIGSVRPLWPDSPETFRRAMIARFDGIPYFAEETRMRTVDGRTVDVLFSLSFPPPDAFMGASLMGMLDITERLKTEAAFRQVSADFAQAARLSTLGEMTTSIAHEVKQPLSAILTNAQTTGRWLTRAEPNLEKGVQLLGRIAQSARHAGDIIDRIQDMAGARAPTRSPLDLNEVVQESLLFVRHESDDKGVLVLTRLADDLPNVLGDRVQLQQIVVNLLVNSFQAMVSASSPRRQIVLSTSADVDSVQVTIRDFGPGISPDHLDQVFDGFFTTKTGGLGIGLAICQSIITAHGGRITAANAADGGAVFQFCVPLAPHQA